MKVFIVAQGSSGDIIPMVGIGKELKNRGHEVTFLANAYFNSLIKEHNMDFYPIDTVENYEILTKATTSEKLDVMYTLTLMRDFLLKEPTRLAYQYIEKNYQKGNSVVIGTSLALSTRIVREKLSIPLATFHLSATGFRSVYKSAKVKGLVIPDWMPKWYKTFIWWLMDALIIDRFMAPPINDFRKELGLTPPIKRIMQKWGHSPDLVVGLFPEWFCEPQPDWPSNSKLAGFPIFDGKLSSHELPTELIEFLSKGEPPIVFTPGSAIRDAKKFFQASLDVCLNLNKRGIFLTKFKEQLPDKLPKYIFHCSYAPLSILLPHTCSIVYHGGIGTCIQALIAGIPQLIVPMVADQYDTASRLIKLGIADELYIENYRSKQAYKKLCRLLNSNIVLQNCQKISKKIKGENGITKAAQCVEALIK